MSDSGREWPSAAEEQPWSYLKESARTSDHMHVHGATIFNLIEQLEAALRSNREKDAQLAEMNKCLNSWACLSGPDGIRQMMNLVGELEHEVVQKNAKLGAYALQINAQSDREVTLLARIEKLDDQLDEKDAKIAELEKQVAATKRGPEFYAYTPGAISDVRLECMIDETLWWKVPGDEVYEVVRELRDKRAKLRAAD